MGPPGTVTRLHFDAARAHGYLGQVRGRKLFVVYPPSDTPFLCRSTSPLTCTQPCYPSPCGQTDQLV